MRTTILTTAMAAAAVAFGIATPVAAQETESEVGADMSISTDDLGEASDDDSSAFLLSGKVGGIYPFNDLGPFVAGGVEIGWVFGGTNRSVAVLLDVTATGPRASAKETDCAPADDKSCTPFDPQRVPGGEYGWDLTEKMVMFQPTFLYRFTSVGSVVPYLGLGPRLYLLNSETKGKVGDEKFKLSEEQSTKFGLGIPLGLELPMGPGGLFFEALVQWAPLDHDITGDSHLASATVFVGYRALL